MKLSRSESSKYASKNVGSCHMAGGFGVVVRGCSVGGEDTVIWSWPDRPDEIRASSVKTEGERLKFRAGRVWIFLDECERT